MLTHITFIEGATSVRLVCAKLMRRFTDVKYLVSGVGVGGRG